MKTFAQVLKENLTKDSFKSSTKPLTFKDEIKKFYIKDTSDIYGSRDFYKNLFKDPIKMVFYWCEEDWQGSLFVIYSYTTQSKQYYIYCDGYFGSCEMCDGFPNTEKSLDSHFNKINICNNINEIVHGEYTHPELLIKFKEFKDALI